MTTTAICQADHRAAMTLGRIELATGNLQQASEKGWGAASQIMKPVTGAPGWHHHLHQIASRLRSEADAGDVYRLFQIAGSLQENQTASHDIDQSLSDIERLSNNLEAIPMRRHAAKPWRRSLI